MTLPRQQNTISKSRPINPIASQSSSTAMIGLTKYVNIPYLPKLHLQAACDAVRCGSHSEIPPSASAFRQSASIQSNASSQNGFEGRYCKKRQTVGHCSCCFTAIGTVGGKAQWLLMQVRWSAALTVASLDGTAKGDRNLSLEDY
ncbi:hypothetical protein DER46DRAFT_596564 [Fusarium sp. MPI-SDFR-AT-0072]|nr:hypothetical protein DER46DRAFT_596564 [Fusarium sp. MPI-SDFR-AT-0072]